jgi:predicted permease
MLNFALIVFCIAAGMALRAAKLIPEGAHKGINAWIIYVALPAAALKYIPKIPWSIDVMFAVAAPVLVWLGSWLLFTALAKWKKWQPKLQHTLELGGGFSNTSFVGFPLVIAYFGEQYLSIAIICDQVMFILLSTIGIIAAQKGGDNKCNKTGAMVIVKKLVTFPPFIACVLALVLAPLFSFSSVEPFLDKMASTVAPLALFSVGMQLSFKGWTKDLPHISLAIFYKLLIAPALVLLAALAFGLKGMVAKISVFEAAMPTVVTSSIIAEQYGLNTKLLNLIIGISILLGLLTTGVWYYILAATL